jgi:crotonobetainyl-CoA:carnitine CoA-transferase CaiB-like acyl-CoA transferase
MSGPLTGLRVVEWAAFQNGPHAGYILGDLGANVIKIEEPEIGEPGRGMARMWGDSVALPGGRGAIFEMSNRNKRSIALNLKNSEGKNLFYQLIEKTDVFFTNYYRNDVLNRLGLDYETLIQHNPGIIYAINSGYGLKGPLANSRAFDPIGQARSGMMWTTGERENSAPCLNVAAVTDQAGGTMLAFAILAALVHRERTGEGQKIEVSLLGSAIHTQYIGLTVHLLLGKGWARHSRTKARNPMANYYLCSDDKWLLLAEPQSDRYWSQFCTCLGKEEWESDPRFASSLSRRENYAEINSFVAETIVTRPRDQWVDMFHKQKVEFAFAPILDVDEVVEDPQVKANNYVTEFNHPVLGPIGLIPLPINFSKTPVAITREPPELGQHTEEVLQEVLGLSWDELARLKESAAIG